MVRTHDKDNIGFQLELVPGTAQTRRSGQYRLALEWAAPVTKAAQVSVTDLLCLSCAC